MKRGDWVVAGERSAPVDPWPGPCGAAASGWAADAPVDTELYARDFTFSRTAFAGHLDVPWDDAQVANRPPSADVLGHARRRPTHRPDRPRGRLTGGTIPPPCGSSGSR